MTIVEQTSTNIYYSSTIWHPFLQLTPSPASHAKVPYVGLLLHQFIHDALCIISMQKPPRGTKSKTSRAELFFSEKTNQGLNININMSIYIYICGFKGRRTNRGLNICAFLKGSLNAEQVFQQKKYRRFGRSVPPPFVRNALPRFQEKHPHFAACVFFGMWELISWCLKDPFKGDLNIATPCSF